MASVSICTIFCAIQPRPATNETTSEPWSATRAKAALEASVRYLAADLGVQGIRVNAISAGPIRTLAGAGIGDARAMFNFQKQHSPLRRSLDIDDVGGAALYMLSDLSSGVTGEVHFVDGGYNVISMPRPEEIAAQ